MRYRCKNLQELKRKQQKESKIKIDKIARTAKKTEIEGN